MVAIVVSNGLLIETPESSKSVKVNDSGKSEREEAER